MNKENILNKEIDLIQGVISRMANNSFLLKGWCISLIAVLLALTKDTIVAINLEYFNLVLVLPVIAFWYLDAYFLHKERCYRRLYNWTIANRMTSDDFLYNLDYTRFKKDEKSIFAIMLSKTLLPLYGLVLLITLALSLHNIIS
mgnify:CR=1 FL=1